MEVALEPEVIRSLDELSIQTGHPRNWVLNTIVLAYLRLLEGRSTAPLASREAIIQI